MDTPFSWTTVGISERSIAPPTMHPAFSSLRKEQSAHILCTDSKSRTVSSSMKTMCVYPPSLRISYSPRANPPLPPRFPLRMTRTGRSGRFPWLSTTNMSASKHASREKRRKSATLRSTYGTLSWVQTLRAILHVRTGSADV